MLLLLLLLNAGGGKNAPLPLAREGAFDREAGCERWLPSAQGLSGPAPRGIVEKIEPAGGAMFEPEPVPGS